MSRSYSTKKLDLTGQRYGNLVVLYPAENIGKRTAWRCRCDCGRECIVKTYHLRDGHTTSCSCVGKESTDDGNRANAGLRSLTFVDGTCVEMLRKNTLRCNNTSGVVGVDWRKKEGRWRASICFKGKRYYLGEYKKFEDALLARKKAEAELHEAFVREIEEKAERGEAVF